MHYRCDDDDRRDGVVKKAIMEGDNEVVPLRDRIIGRYSTDDIINPSNPSEKVLTSGSLITEEIASTIDALGITRVRVMSPLSSRIKNGLTALEYGIDPSTNSLVKAGFISWYYCCSINRRTWYSINNEDFPYWWYR